MRALVYQHNTLTFDPQHPVLSPATGEALVRVLYAGICNTDIEIVRGYMHFEGIIGHEFAGIVEAVNLDPARHSPESASLIGKRVNGEINAACCRQECWYCSHSMPTHCPDRTTLGIAGRDGAFAGYLTLPIENLHLIPDTVSDEEAVFVEPLAANFEMLEQVHIKPTDRAVVLGDGKMGQLAAQVLALTGCEVIMVGKHEDKLSLASRRGITTLLLRDADTFALDNGRRADLVVECTGAARGLELAMRLVRPRGTIMLKSTVADQSTLHLAPIVIDEIRVQGSRCGPFAPALRALSNRSVDISPLISARFSLDDGLAAFDYATKPGVLKVLLKVW